MSLSSLLQHSCDVEKIPDTPTRDSSGGIVDSSWSAVYSSVPCLRNPASASRMADFAIAGVRITDVVTTLQSGIKAGQRLKFTDGDGTNTVYLRVDTVKYVPRMGSIGPFYELACEEIRLQ